MKQPCKGFNMQNKSWNRNFTVPIAKNPTNHVVPISTEHATAIRTLVILVMRVHLAIAGSFDMDRDTRARLIRFITRMITTGARKDA